MVSPKFHVHFDFDFYPHLSLSQDAHNSIPDFDEDTAMFAVYDGHGGNALIGSLFVCTSEYYVHTLQFIYITYFSF